MLFESDALALPLRDASLDLITVAFGFRNLANYQSGLARNAARIASRRHGGDPGVYPAAECRLRRALQPLLATRPPWIGGFISGSRDAYTYLPESVRKFPVAPELAAMMRRAGFADVSFEYLTGGIVALHLGRIT